MTMPLTEKLVSTVGLSQILNCSRRSIARYANTGKIPAPIRLSGSIKWKISDIELFLGCNCDMTKYQEKREAENEK